MSPNFLNLNSPCHLGATSVHVAGCPINVLKISMLIKRTEDFNVYFLVIGQTRGNITKARSEALKLENVHWLKTGSFSTMFRSTWLTVFVVELAVISIINGFTILTFARNRHLRKRTTYLIINLTIADFLWEQCPDPCIFTIIRHLNLIVDSAGENLLSCFWRECLRLVLCFTSHCYRWNGFMRPCFRSDTV